MFSATQRRRTVRVISNQMSIELTTDCINRFYEARVDDITSDGQCTVVFKHKKVSEVCLFSLLKPLGKKKIKPSNTTTSFSGDANRLKRKQLTEQKDYLKKKQQKKKERLKGLEEEREKDKMKWQSFNTKVSINCFHF